ncbi:PNP1 [Candida oxycetoniae]|uniref:Purine nucleoside phosphorylase n=1 Tax=Candida oxycetoniae TaxID=497107 RepID=A0AAI9SYN0_9ASCO|nr:PNP1 [Candida oxycetoniae]KAI3405586.1 PNP1 [Candida oxycetoniae]
MAESIPLEEYSRQLEHATAIVNSKIKGTPSQDSRVMIICGSGLGGIASTLDANTIIEIPYSDIPGFKISTVQGHAGKLVFGLMGTNKVPVMCMVGRLHFYEGYSFQETTFPVRVACKLGISIVIVTNAAGGINPSYNAGELMLIEDHVNLPGLAGWHPLRGPNLDNFGPRFLPLSDAYDHSLRSLFVETAQRELGLTRKINEGTYFFAAGPTFESRAEVRAIRALGGDAVGMSTVPEVIVARHCGMKVLALSLITNDAVGEKPPSAFSKNPKALEDGIASHAEVLKTADEASEDVKKIIEAVVNHL